MPFITFYMIFSYIFMLAFLDTPKGVTGYITFAIMWPLSPIIFPFKLGVLAYVMFKFLEYLIDTKLKTKNY